MRVYRVTSRRDTDRGRDSEVVCGVIYVHMEYGYPAITRTVSAAVAMDTIIFVRFYRRCCLL